jgi:hypothetical protein
MRHFLSNFALFLEICGPNIKKHHKVGPKSEENITKINSGTSKCQGQHFLSLKASTSAKNIYFCYISPKIASVWSKNSLNKKVQVCPNWNI